VTGGRQDLGRSVDPLVAPAAICRAVLLGRAAVVLTAASAGLLVVQDRWRVLAVLGIVTVATAIELTVLTRWHAVVRHPWLAVGVDLLVALAVLVFSSGGMAYFCYVAGSAALAGALLGMRALPLWAGQAALGFAAAGAVLQANRPPPEVTAFIVAFPTVSVLAGVGTAAATSALVRYVELAVTVIAAAQRSAAATERARLARELHDSLAKTLRGVSFAALALPSSLRRHPALAEQLASTVSLGAEAAAREARQLMEALRADALDQDFDASVHMICRSWAATTGISTTVVAERVEPPVSVRYELGRILQEALHNVERHARARHVRVRLVRVDDEIELTVQDDGIGFVPRDIGTLRSGGHYGIVGMSERARTVKGTLQVTSTEGGGTLVTVRASLDDSIAFPGLERLP
jgi:signal transduction histidine kinase